MTQKEVKEILTNYKADRDEIEQIQKAVECMKKWNIDIDEQPTKEDLERLQMQKEKIINLIALVPDQKQKRVLTYRYIDNMSFNRIAEKMFYSVDSIFRIHRNAIRAIATIKK